MEKLSVVPKESPERGKNIEVEDFFFRLFFSTASFSFSFFLSHPREAGIVAPPPALSPSLLLLPLSSRFEVACRPPVGRLRERNSEEATGFGWDAVKASGALVPLTLALASLARSLRGPTLF